MFITHPLLLLAAGLGLASAQSPDAFARESPPSGCAVVRKLGPQAGEHPSVGAAIEALDKTATAPACIFIHPGVYAEQLFIDYKGPLVIYGYTPDTRSYENNTVIISHNLPASDDVPILNSSTLWVRTESFGLYNVEVWNTFDAEQGVAVAVSADGNKQGFYGVTLKGHGATLNARAGDQYYSHSYIEGSFNYIFGRASAWFEQCTIASNGAGVITASAREDADDPSWFVFNNSRIVGAAVADASLTPGSVWLGNPLSYLARVMFQFCNLSGLVAPEGYYNEVFYSAPKFYEFDNTGDGANTTERVLLSPATQPVTDAEIWPQSGTVWHDPAY